MIFALNLILNLAFAAVPTTVGEPMKSPMGHILNSVLNGDLKQTKLEPQPLVMKNYQLFVYVGQTCSTCPQFLSQLNQLALAQKKSINVIFVYDHTSKPDQNLIDQASRTDAYEFYDGQGHMYHHLFNNPRHLNFILTGPRHTVIHSGQLSSLDEIIKIGSLITKKD
ncbi:MAG: hypothetical protein ACK5V3_11575 [Bdellovibrionales bacterium]